MVVEWVRALRAEETDPGPDPIPVSAPFPSDCRHPSDDGTSRRDRRERSGEVDACGSSLTPPSSSTTCKGVPEAEARWEAVFAEGDEPIVNEIVVCEVGAGLQHPGCRPTSRRSSSPWSSCSPAPEGALLAGPLARRGPGGGADARPGRCPDRGRRLHRSQRPSSRIRAQLRPDAGPSHGHVLTPGTTLAPGAGGGAAGRPGAPRRGTHHSPTRHSPPLRSVQSPQRAARPGRSPCRNRGGARRCSTPPAAEVTVVGAGNVGATTAQRIAESDSPTSS